MRYLYCLFWFFVLLAVMLAFFVGGFGLGIAIFMCMLVLFLGAW